jgi:hypothetical protein
LIAAGTNTPDLAFALQPVTRRLNPLWRTEMRRYLIPAVSLAALTMSGMAFAQTTTTPPAADQPAQMQNNKPDCSANPADPACAANTTADQKTTPPAGTDTNTGANTTGNTTTVPDTTTGSTTPPATTNDAAKTTTAPDTTGSTTATTTDTGKSNAATTADTSGPGFLASNFIGKTVYSTNKENVGDINDLLVGTNGQVKAAVIGVGGFLGMGEKDVAVPLDKLSMTKDQNGMDYLTITSTRADLEAAPAFDRTVVTGSLK